MQSTSLVKQTGPLDLTYKHLYSRAIINYAFLHHPNNSPNAEFFTLRITKRNMNRSKSKRRRSSSDPVNLGGLQGKAKLSKPPPLASLHERPRNRLRKRGTTMGIAFTAPATQLQVLEEEPYPYNTLPSRFLGIYSTINSVTNGAIEHGAYTFSREGVLNGSEYLNGTGRIRIQTQLLQDSGTDVVVSLRSHSPQEQPARLSGPVRSDVAHPTSLSETLIQTTRQDVPHPAAQSTTSLRDPSEPKQIVFLAVREGPTAAHCLGVFTRASLAWGACLKNKASCGLSRTLDQEVQEVDADGMPRATARLHGCGQHVWFVAAKEVDATTR